ncbi:MFS transporter [Streptomyces sp. TM32]|uniref:MFS transporter n=1 Tax=Streptomyces sp. TM32 TaxID=1652669 RepID=UPI001011BBBA|nr:MFS transporter [Streptomyces sp. TM32]RXS88406.1 MFS transporter [Streptomyces sp. TM32]
MSTLNTRPAETQDEVSGPFAWFRGLPRQGRKAFFGAFGGYALDSYDFQVLPLGLVAIAAYFHLSKGQAGLLTTVTLVVSALGGILAGVLIDKIGRSRTLMLTVATYATFTVLCGFAVNYPMLLACRALQGLGFGGEWAAGAILVAEYASTRYRGRTVAFVQGAWAAGWGLAVIVATTVLDHVHGDLAWRVLFWTGALPGLLLLYLRRSVNDAPRANSRPEKGESTPVTAVFGRGLLRTTLFASLLATGVQGGYYTIATWLPTYLKTERHLTVVGTGSYLFLLITGAFLGYLTGGYLTDWLGRRKAIALFAVLSGGILFAYTHIPAGANQLLLVLGFPLGFCASAIFSGFGSFLAELYPTEVRGTGQGLTYNVGRAVGAFFPTAVGFQAGGNGLGGALVYGAVGYVIALVALLGLPETRGRALD